MRIVDVCPFYAPSAGGVRTYVDAKLRSAARLGHELIVVAPGAEDRVVKVGSGAVLATVAAPKFQLDRRYRYFNDEGRLHRELSRWHPDHVECSSPWSSAGMVGRWQGKATRSLFMHSDPIAAHGYRLLRMCSHAVVDRLFARFWAHLRALGGLFDTIVCPSSQLSQRLSSKGVQRVETLSLGVAGDFSPRWRSERLRGDLLQGLGLPPSGCLLLGVGRLGAEKRWDLVIEGVSAAARAQPVGLILVGDGPRRAALLHMSRDMPSVRLAAPIADRTELAKLMASADALVHGCEAETYGLVIAEARASGLPLIVPDRGGAFEQLQDGVGVSYAAGSAKSLEQALLGYFRERDRFARGAGQVCHVPGLDEHFERLFARFGALGASALADTAGLKAAA